MLQEYQMVTHYLDRIADAYDRSLERYIALLSATLGIVFGLQQLSSSQGIEWSVAAGILSIPLMAGSIWYMGNVTRDIELWAAFNRRKGAYLYFAKHFPDATSYLDIDPSLDRSYVQAASLSGIFRRALSYGSTKTVLAVGNSILLAVISFIVLSNAFTSLGRMPTLILSCGLFLLSILGHAGYARIRYHFNRKTYH